MHDQDALPVVSDPRAVGELREDSPFPEMKPVPAWAFYNKRQPPLSIFHQMVWTALSAT